MRVVSTTTSTALDIERLFRLRLVIARLGEQENARWWQTKGLLGSTGAFVMRRGFSRTHAFAQARAAFAVAAARCQAAFASAQVITLWNLPAEIEEQFEDEWLTWMDAPERYAPLFAQVAGVSGRDVLDVLRQFELVNDAEIAAVRRLRAEDGVTTLPIPADSLDDQRVTLLAAAFAHSQPDRPVVPYLPVRP
jgi:hypothetical protein